MPDSPIVDVAMALAFFYVTLSLVCSSIQEIIAGVFGLRSRNLRRGIENLVGNEYARAFYRRWSRAESHCRSGRAQSGPAGLGATVRRSRLK